GPRGVGSTAEAAHEPISPHAGSEPKGGPGGVGSTGDSVRGEDSPSPVFVGEYWADFRPIRTLTLEDLMQEHGLDHIDILKLDCEGSEFSILSKTPSLDRIGLIVGEYHGKENFDRLVAERFADWTLKIIRRGDLR